MSSFTYSISTNDSIHAGVLLRIARLIDDDDLPDDEAQDAVFYVLDALERHIETDNWLGVGAGVQSWASAGDLLRMLAGSIDRSIAKHEKRYGKVENEG